MKKKQANRPRAPKGGMTFRGKLYRGGCFIPAEAAKYLAPAKPKLTDEHLIMLALAEMPCSVEASQALHRYMQGRQTQRDRTILKCRELQAIESLREAATSQRDWTRWNDRYVHLAGGIA